MGCGQSLDQDLNTAKDINDVILYVSFFRVSNILNMNNTNLPLPASCTFTSGDGAPGAPGIGFNGVPPMGWYLNEDSEVVFTSDLSDVTIQNANYIEFKRPIVINEYAAPTIDRTSRGILYKKANDEGLYWKTASGEVNLANGLTPQMILNMRNTSRIVEVDTGVEEFTEEPIVEPVVEEPQFTQKLQYANEITNELQILAQPGNQLSPGFAFETCNDAGIYLEDQNVCISAPTGKMISIKNDLEISGQLKLAGGTLITKPGLAGLFWQTDSGEVELTPNISSAVQLNTDELSISDPIVEESSKIDKLFNQPIMCEPVIESTIDGVLDETPTFYAENNNDLTRPEFSFVNDLGTGISHIDSNVVGLVAGEQLALAAAQDQVIVYKPLSIVDSDALPSVVETEGKLYKKANCDGLFWQTKHNEIDLSTVSYPLLADSTDLHHPSYSFKDDISLGLAKDGRGVSIVQDGQKLASFTAEKGVIPVLYTDKIILEENNTLQVVNGELVLSIGDTKTILGHNVEWFNGGVISNEIDTPGVIIGDYHLATEEDVFNISTTSNKSVLNVDNNGVLNVKSVLLDNDLNNNLVGIVQLNGGLGLESGNGEPVVVDDVSVNFKHRKLEFGDAVLEKRDGDLYWIAGTDEYLLNKKVDEEVSNRVSEEVSARVAEEVSARVAQSVSEEVSSRVATDVSTKVAQSVSEEVSTDVSTKVAEEVSTKVAQSVSEEVSNRVSSRVAEEVSNRVSSRVAEEVSSRVAKEVSNRVSAEVSSRVAEEVSNRVAEEVSSRVSTEVSTKVSEEVSNRVSTDVSSRVAQSVSEEVSNRVAEEVSSRVARSVSEEVSNRVSTKVAEEVSTKVAEKTVADALANLKPAVQYQSTVSYTAAAKIKTGDLVCMDPYGSGKVYKGLGGNINNLSFSSDRCVDINVFNYDVDNYCLAITKSKLFGKLTKLVVSLLKVSKSTHQTQNIYEYVLNINEETSSADDICKVLQIDQNTYVIVTLTCDTQNIKTTKIVNPFGVVPLIYSLTSQLPTQCSNITAQYDASSDCVVLAGYCTSQQNITIALILAGKDSENLQLGTIETCLSTTQLLEPNKQLHLVLIPGGTGIVSYGITKIVFVISSYLGSITYGDAFVDYESVDCASMFYDLEHNILVTLEKTISGSCYIQVLTIIGISIQKLTNRGFNNANIEPLSVAYNSTLGQYTIVYATGVNNANIYVQVFEFDGDTITLGLRYQDLSGVYNLSNNRNTSNLYEIPSTNLFMYNYGTNVISIFESKYHGEPSGYLGIACNDAEVAQPCDVLIKGHIYTSSVILSSQWIGKKVYISDVVKSFPDYLSINSRYGVFFGTCLDDKRILLGL